MTMPIFLQYISFVLGVLSFFLTAFTLKTTYSVKRELLYRNEQQQFLNDYDSINGRIGGFIMSLQKQNITDSLLKDIRFFMVDLETKYTFFPRKVKTDLHSIRVLSSASCITDENNVNIIAKLIRLKNNLEKERRHEFWTNK